MPEFTKTQFSNPLDMCWQMVCQTCCDFFFFLESFNLWRPLLIIALYYQTKTPISFWCMRWMNPRSLIQPSETLPIELTGTHQTCCDLRKKYNISNIITLTFLRSWQSVLINEGWKRKTHYNWFNWSTLDGKLLNQIT